MKAAVLKFAPRDDGPEPPMPLDMQLVVAARGFLAVREAICPWSDSVLISGLAGASREEREAIYAELEARRRGR